MKQAFIAGFFIFTAILNLSKAAFGADLDHGAVIYEECKGCHDLRENLMGPRHCWVVGRPAGKVPGFTYSDAMKNAKLVWDQKTLDRFLTMPLEFVPGTIMGYAGIFDKKDREDLIGYLEKLTGDPQACDGVDKLR